MLYVRLCHRIICHVPAALCVLLVPLLLTVPTVVQAGDFTFTTNYNGTLNLFLYSGTNPVVTIPSPINGLMVTSIGSGAFDANSIVTSVTIPDGVLSIHANAFDGCFNLTNITIPDSVNDIEAYVFDNCSKLTNVTLPNSLTSIEDDTFYYCSSLTSITIPAGVSYIGNDVFYACSKLTSIYFQSNAPSVGSDVFGRDHSVTIYDLPGTTGWTNFAQATGLAPVLWLLPNPTIAHSGNSVIVSWPNSGSYTLQQNVNLALANGWATAGYPITTANATNSITISSPTGKLFFRLVK